MKVDKVKSADRALELIEILVHAPHGLIHSELALYLGIPKSSLTKILSSLMRSGYVKRIDGTTYMPGERWQSLVKASITGASIDILVRPSLERLVRETGETSGFNMVVGEQVETISTVVSSKQLQFTMNRGERAPLHKMSSGQAILAHMSQAFQDRYYNQVLSENPHSPFRDQQLFAATMAEIRQQGYAEVGGFREGIVGVGCPILSADGRPKASVNVATPAIRYSKAHKFQTIECLKAVASDLAKRLDAWIDAPEEWLKP
ncbi:MAG TPA: IclR family transcriptional regulator [Sphingobium sp.]|nr:IclR family transcriptional regulator [Sphingobium sp.]